MTLAPLGMAYSPMLRGEHGMRGLLLPTATTHTPVVSPGVGEGHVWDEQGGHGPDAQHFADGGLQVGQQRAVAEVGVTGQADFLVHLLLDLPLDLGGEQGLGVSTQHHQQVMGAEAKCSSQLDSPYSKSLTSLLALSFPKAPCDAPGAEGRPAGHGPYLRVVKQVEHGPFEHGCGGLHASPEDVPHCHEEVVIRQLQPWCRWAVVLGAEPHLQEGIHEVPHGVPTEGFLPGDTAEPPQLSSSTPQPPVPAPSAPCVR